MLESVSALLSLTRVIPPTPPEGCCCRRPGCHHLRRRSCVPSVASVTLSGCRAVVATGRCLGALLLVLGGSPLEGGSLDGLVDLVAGLVGGLRGHVAQCEVVSVLLPGTRNAGVKRADDTTSCISASFQTASTCVSMFVIDITGNSNVSVRSVVR